MATSKVKADNKIKSMILSASGSNADITMLSYNAGHTIYSDKLISITCFANESALWCDWYTDSNWIYAVAYKDESKTTKYTGTANYLCVYIE